MWRKNLKISKETLKNNEKQKGQPKEKAKQSNLKFGL